MVQMSKKTPSINEDDCGLTSSPSRGLAGTEITFPTDLCMPARKVDLGPVKKSQKVLTVETWVHFIQICIVLPRITSTCITLSSTTDGRRAEPAPVGRPVDHRRTRKN